MYSIDRTYFYCTRKKLGSICRNFTENNASKNHRTKWCISVFIETDYKSEIKIEVNYRERHICYETHNEKFLEKRFTQNGLLVKINDSTQVLHKTPLLKTWDHNIFGSVLCSQNQSQLKYKSSGSTLILDSRLLDFFACCHC